MTERVVVQDIAEVSSKPTPGSELPAFQGEVLSRATFGASAASFTPETAVAPLPPNLTASLLAESLAGPWPPIDAPIFLVEVLRRDTASSGHASAARAPDTAAERTGRAQRPGVSMVRPPR